MGEELRRYIENIGQQMGAVKELSRKLHERLATLEAENEKLRQANAVCESQIKNLGDELEVVYKEMGGEKKSEVDFEPNRTDGF